MPCIKCPNGKWKYGEKGKCQFDTLKKCQEAAAAIHIKEGEMPKKLERAYHLLLTGNGTIRTAEFDGKEHMVVPVVALVEGVIFPFNADAPEFVPEDVLAASVSGWNGRPVVINHPQIGETRVAANNPKILEKYQVGQVFNARMDGKQLKMEAWLDVSRMETLNEDSKVLLDNIKNNQIVEVSIGAFVVADEEAQGAYKGQQFFTVWEDLMPDHLALLPEGMEGACNVDMGCGTPRAAASYLMTLDGPRRVESMTLPAFRKKLAAFLESKKDEVGFRILEITDHDLRRSLDGALSGEAGYLWLDSILLESQKAVYAVEAMGQVKLYTRGYTLDSNNSVELADEREEVRAETNFVPVTASADPDVSTASDCGCQKGTSMTVKNQAARIKALVESKRTPWSEDDVKYLEEFDEDRLARQETLLVEEEPEPAPEPASGPESTPAVSEPAPVKAEVSQEDIRKVVQDELGLDIDEAKRLIEESKARAAARKKELISVLEQQDVYSKEELETMEVKALEKLATLVGKKAPPVDHSLNGTEPRDDSDDAVPQPKTMSAVFQKEQVAS